MKPTRTGMVAALVALFSLLGALVAQTALASEMSDFIDDYDEIVVIYEKLADKPAICASDSIQISTELLPKLNAFSQKAAGLQSSFTAGELQRYMEVSQRFSQAMMKLSSKMGNITC